MKINFKQRFLGDQRFAECVTPYPAGPQTGSLKQLGVEGLRGYGILGEVEGVEYNLSSIRERALGILENALGSLGHLVRRTSDSNLWVSEPEPFSLDVDSRATHTTFRDKTKVHKDCLFGEGTFGERTKQVSLEEVGTVECQKPTFPLKVITYQVPVLREVPDITVEGHVYFENIDGVDPNPVLDFLQDQGYASKVITTPQEVEEKMHKISRGSRRSSSGSRGEDLSDASNPMNLVNPASPLSILGGDL